MKRALWIFCTTIAALPAFAQQPTVMKEGQVSESALIEALTPAPPPALTRSIRVVREEPQREASASLLITFDTNSARLTPHARHALDVVAQALGSDKLAGHRFRIEGHADPRGESDANMRLSRQRAESVSAYLASKGIDTSRLQPIGKGDHELLRPADPAAAENRRVTFVTVN
jgi:OOP family OmpA-OmpF porin